jgi:hypothetical protein
MHLFRTLALSAMLLGVWSGTARSAEPDYALIPTEKLIDQLTLIDSPVPGVDGQALYDRSSLRRRRRNSPTAS